MPLIDYRIFRMRGVRQERLAAGVAPLLVTNRVWYTPGGYEVRWQTTTPDTTGSSYPGPGVFGTDTTNYTVDDPGNVS